MPAAETDVKLLSELIAEKEKLDPTCLHSIRLLDEGIVLYRPLLFFQLLNISINLLLKFGVDHQEVGCLRLLLVKS